MFAFLLFCWLIASLIIISNKSKEINNLKNDKINFCPQCGFNLMTKTTQPTIENTPNETTSSAVKTEPIMAPPVQPKHSEQEIKNSSILIAGSILLVLGAVVFLTTTWQTTHGSVKTLVLLLMLGVFVGVYYLAEKQFHLKDTAKTFYYISLAYIPIVLLSVSMFGLLGDYLSINGPGNYLYLAICALFLTFLYSFCAKKKNSRLLEISSFIFSCMTVIFIGLIFNKIFIVIISLLIIYTWYLSIIYEKNIIFWTKSIQYKAIHALSAILFILTILNSINHIIFNCINVFDIIASVLLLVNTYYTLHNITNDQSLRIIVLPIAIIIAFLNMALLHQEFNVVQVLLLISFIFVYAYNLIMYNKINITTTIETIASAALLYLYTCAYSSISCGLLPSYFIALAIAGLSYLSYAFAEKNQKQLAFLLSGAIIITVLDFIRYLNISTVIFGYTCIILIFIFFIINDKYLKPAFTWVGNIALIMFFASYFENSILLLTLYGLYMITNFWYFAKSENSCYQIITYIFSNAFIISLLNLLGITDINTLILAIPFTTCLICLLEMLAPGIKNKNHTLYVIISFVCSLFALNIVSTTIPHFVFLLCICASFIAYILTNKLNKYMLYIPLTAIIPYIYFKDLFVIDGLNYMYIGSLLLITATVYLLYFKRQNIFAVLFYVYTFLNIISFDQSKYINIALLLIGTLIMYLIKTEKVKDMFKALLYILLFVLTQFFVTDLCLNSLTVLTYGLALATAILITRDIVKKHSQNYKVFAYVVCSLICFFAFSNYYNEYDGMLFVCFLTLVVFISYTHKYGPEFLVSLIFIVINFFLLTREFWLNIPWWLYILLIGGILIGFAVNNEVNDKKEKRNVFSDIKKKLDL